jgi:tetratricopeptide (TPR) repeat protein
VRLNLSGAIAAWLVAMLVPLAASGQLEQAGKLYRAGEYRRAEELAIGLSKGLAERERADALLLLGRIQLETGRTTEALKSARDAGRSSKSAARAFELEGEALLRTGGDAVASLESAVKAAGSGAGWRARLLLARAHLRRGDVLAARSLLEGLADAYNDGSLPETDVEGIASLASAMAELEYWQDANDMFAEATKLDPGRVETQTEWARLFLEKYDAGHAEECLRDALKANPNHAEAHVLMAKVRMEQGFDFVQAGEELDAALLTDPNLVEAYAFKATLEAHDRLWEDAQGLLDKALSIDPSDPYALSVRAAVYYVADDRPRYEKTVAALRARDRRFTGHLEVMTELLEWEHRYAEIVELQRQALADDPSSWPAHAAIGINLLRQGEEDEGLRELRESWNHDRFNVLVYNMLELYDEVLTKEYRFVKRGPITYRFQQDEQKVLERYVPDLLERAYREMSGRYGIRPSETVVEVFASEDHFARRSVGLPRVGVQGICFGKVVVAGGPHAAPVNTGQVLWHELGHVFTIQLSKSRVPRWLTEGLSVREESLGSSHWARGNDGAFYRWVKAGRMPPVASLDRAFSRARSGAEMGLAYYGSAKLTEFIEQRHGWPKVLDMLRLYGQGKRTPEVVKRVLGVEPADLDREFRDFTLKRLASYAGNFQVDYDWYHDLDAIRAAVEKNPTDAVALADAAVASLANRDREGAEGFAAKALSIDPAEPRAHHVLCDVAAATERFDEAARHFAAIQAKGLDGYGLRLDLAAAAQKTGNLAAAVAHFEKAAALDPQQPEPHLGIAKIHLEAGREDAAVAAMRQAADLEPHDRGLYRDLVARLAKRGEWDLVRQYGERSLWNDPFHAPLHVSLARAYEKTGGMKQAIFELESALLCEPEDAASVHVELGRLLLKAGQRARAREHAGKALEIDSSSTDAQALIRELGGEARR